MDRLISEKEAIEAINDYWGEMETPTIDGYINAIKTIPSAEPSGDLISKQEVLDLIADYDLSMRQVVRSIHTLPSVKLQEPKAVLYSGDGYADGYMVYDMAECPNCGREFENGDETWNCNFCPDCGQALNWESEDKE